MTFEGEWARCSPWLEAALDHAGNTHDLDDVRSLVCDGEATFWPGAECAAVTEVIRHPNKTLLHVWLSGGDLNELTERLLPRVVEYAVAQGFHAITLIGRPGFERVLTTKGFAPVARFCMKELTQ